MQLNTYLQSADNAGNWFNRDWMVKSKLQKCIATDRPHRQDPVMQSPYNMGASALLDRDARSTGLRNRSFTDSASCNVYDLLNCCLHRGNFHRHSSNQMFLIVLT